MSNDLDAGHVSDGTYWYRRCAGAFAMHAARNKARLIGVLSVS